MVLKQQLTAKLSQKLVMTPSLQQAIKMLQMNRIEIENLIQAELEKNVVLEVTGDSPSEHPAEISAERAAERREENERAAEKEDPFSKIDVEAFFADYMDSAPTFQRNTFEVNPDQPSFEQMLSDKPSLTEHLIWQLELSTENDTVKEIGKAIIGNLNKAGYLRATVEEIENMDPDFTTENVERALNLVQGFDPIGVGARDLAECLLLQMEYLEIEDEILEQIITNYLNHIEIQDYETILKELNITREDLKEKLDIIRHLDPKPGLKYNNDRVIYIEPEVFVSKENGEYKIRLNDDGLPRLRINPYYKNLAGMKESGDEGAVEYIREKMKAAMWLLKSFDQRQKTIYKVTESILKHQMDFFEYGDEHLKPMVLSDIAQDISMHESTVSRVVNNKYMHTPRGVYELKYFFQRGIASDSGEDISSVIVKKKIEDLVSDEDPRKPLSDAKIAEYLAGDGLQIARRTVAKYREELKIPSSSKRRKKI